MTSFAHIDYPTQHPGVIRLENVIGAFQQLAADLKRSRGATAVIARTALVLFYAAGTAALSWIQHHRRARAEALLWEMARHDRRLMTELRCAQDRA